MLEFEIASSMKVTGPEGPICSSISESRIALRLYAIFPKLNADNQAESYSGPL